MSIQSEKGKITVVVPVYNRAGLLTRCLDSIAAQSMPGLSLIIVDNNSTDNSLEVARRWAESHSGDMDIRILTELRPGAARARQTGLEAVSTEWVQFFDSDDAMAPGILSAALSQCAGMDMVCWKQELTGLDGHRTTAPFRPDDILRGHAYNGMLSTLTYMVRTDFIRRAGGWKPEIRVWDDWELGFRLLLKNPAIRCLNQIGAVVYSQEESITGTSFNAKAGQWEEIIDIVGTYAPDRRDIQLMLDYRRVNLAALYTREGHPELGRSLLKVALRKTACSPAKRSLLRLIYRYTALGGRGAYRLWR